MSPHFVCQCELDTQVRVLDLLLSKISCSMCASQYFVSSDEMQRLAKDNENLEAEIERLKEELSVESHDRHKLERVMADASQALKFALRVSLAIRSF